MHEIDNFVPGQRSIEDDFMASYGLSSDPGKYCIVVNYVVFEANKIKFKPNQTNRYKVSKWRTG